jgi:hypothetical protein
LLGAVIATARETVPSTQPIVTRDNADE